jgi:hypothetical protein
MNRRPSDVLLAGRIDTTPVEDLLAEVPHSVLAWRAWRPDGIETQVRRTFAFESLRILLASRYSHGSVIGLVALAGTIARPGGGVVSGTVARPLPPLFVRWGVEVVTDLERVVIAPGFWPDGVAAEAQRLGLPVLESVDDPDWLAQLNADAECIRDIAGNERRRGAVRDRDRRVVPIPTASGA